MSEDLNTILQSPSKEVQSARGVLAKVFRTICKDVGITPSVWHKLMQQFLNNPMNGIPPEDGKKRSSTRGNLNKAFSRSVMSWKTFITAISFLSPVHADFQLTLTWRNKKVTVHKIDIDFANINLNDTSDEEDK